MAKRTKKDKVIFETFGHITMVKTATPDKKSLLQIIITIDANKTYVNESKKKRGKKE